MPEIIVGHTSAQESADIINGKVDLLSMATINGQPLTNGGDIIIDTLTVDELHNELIPIVDGLSQLSTDVNELDGLLTQLNQTTSTGLSQLSTDVNELDGLLTQLNQTTSTGLAQLSTDVADVGTAVGQLNQTTSTGLSQLSTDVNELDGLLTQLNQTTSTGLAQLSTDVADVETAIGQLNQTTSTGLAQLSTDVADVETAIGQLNQTTSTGLAQLSTDVNTFQQTTDNKLDGLQLSLDGLQLSVEDTTKEIHYGFTTVNDSLNEIKTTFNDQIKTWSYSYVWDSNNLLQQETKTSGNQTLTRFYTWTSSGLLETITNWEVV